MMPLERFPKITQTHKITFYGRVFSSKDLRVWLESLPADAEVTVTQVQTNDPRESDYTSFTSESVQVHHEH